MEKVIRKHLNAMVDEILEQAMTYKEVCESLSTLKLLGVPEPGGLLRTLEKMVKNRALGRKIKP